MAKLNFLIMGKSGIGKSTLINYLLGELVAETGIGKPVTGKEIRAYSPININGIDMVFHDSWGLEADKASEWMDKILTDCEIREKSLDINNWFHGFIYCINAGDGRIENYEIENIIKPLINSGVSIIFALTKADAASKEAIENKISILKGIDEKFKILTICSKQDNIRGKIIEKFGRDDLLEAVSSNVRENLILNIKRVFEIKTQLELSAFKLNLLNFFELCDGFFKTNQTIVEQIDAYSKILTENLVYKLQYWLLHNLTLARHLFLNFGSEFNLNNSVVTMDSFIQQMYSKLYQNGLEGRSINLNFKGVGEKSLLEMKINDFHIEITNLVNELINTIEL